MPAKADGEVWIRTKIDNSKAQKDLDKLTDQIAEQEKTIEQLEKKRSEAEKQGLFSAAELDNEKAKLQELKKELEEIKLTAKDTSFGDGVRSEAKAAIPGATVAVKEQAERVRLLQSEFNKIDNSVIKYGEKIEAATEKLQTQKVKAGELVRELAAAQKNTVAMSPAIEEANRRMERFSKRIKEVVKSALIFSVITKALSAFKEWAADIVMANEESRKSIAQLRAALLTLVQPLVERVIPAFNALVNVLTRAVTAMAKITSKLFGTTIKQSAEAAEKLNQEAEAIKNVENTAKKAGKTLASFDEINQLSSGGAASGEASGGGLTSAGEEIRPDFSFYDTVQEKITEFEVYISGALLAVGAILTFSGASVALGLGLMAVGALGLGSAIVENWDAMPNSVKGAISKTLVVLGAGSLAIGAILTFSGANLPLGIGLMAAGAASLGTAAALNWDAITQALQGPIGAITAIASGAALALGVVLAFTGVALPLGIALIAAGAVGLVATTALNWETITQALQGPVGAIVALASGALLALGLVLAFTGVALPLGIALIAAGAVGLVTTTALNWDTIVNALQGPVGKVVAIASGILLVLGIILAFTGVALPLGIALIAAGAVGLVTVTALNWDAILEKLKGAWGNIKNWWNTSVKKYFTKAYWQEKFAVIGESLTGKIKDGINSAISLLNRFINWVNDKLHISWDALTIAGKEIIPSGDIQLLKIPNIPELATGAVIPPNREFLAVLGDQRSGTNIEAPESLIRKIVREEAGGMNSELLEQILQAIKAGKVIQVDKRVLGKTAAEGINDLTKQTGKPVLLY